MYAALLVMSLVSRFFYTARFNAEILNVLITFLMVMLFTAVWVVTLVIIVRRFWTNLLGREGYLMNVLPVSTWQHVLAKCVTSGVWVIAGMVVSAAAFLIMLLGLPELADIDLAEFFSELSHAVSQLREEGVLGQSILFAVQLVLLMIAGSFEFILSAYAAMCIGQLANRHRTWASIGAYFGINMVQSFITQLTGQTDFFNIPVTVPSNVPGAALIGVNQLLAVMLVICLLICAALFFVSSILLKKKLNLQ